MYQRLRLQHRSPHSSHLSSSSFFLVRSWIFKFPPARFVAHFSYQRALRTRSLSITLKLDTRVVKFFSTFFNDATCVDCHVSRERRTSACRFFHQECSFSIVTDLPADLQPRTRFVPCTRQLRNTRARGVFEVGSFSRSASIDRRESARTVTNDNVLTKVSISDDFVGIREIFTRTIGTREVLCGLLLLLGCKGRSRISREFLFRGAFLTGLGGRLGGI